MLFDALVHKQARQTPPEPKLSRADANAVLRNTVGERFVLARKMNGWDQSVAAQKMGYTNSTQLSLIEQSKRLPPLEILIKGSEVYAVSVDFLLGLSDEPERDPKAAERGAAMRHVHSLIAGTTSHMVSLLMQYLAHGVPSVSSAKALLTRCQALVDEVHRTREMNPKAFDDKLKNGSRLVRSAVAAGEACSTAKEMLDRHDRITDFKITAAEARSGVTHPLFDEQAKQQMGIPVQ